MKRYVLGIVRYYDSVVLLKKLKPEWQTGLLNGIGGKVESGESYEAAMKRETIEEMGEKYSSLVWDNFCVIESSRGDWKMSCFVVNLSQDEYRSIPHANDVGERYKVYPRYELGDIPTIPNIPWLVAMSDTVNQHEWPYKVTVNDE